MMRPLLSVLFFGSMAVVGTVAVDYTDLEAMGASCPPKDSCYQIGHRNFSQRNCECDRLCAAYHDCCIDASVPVALRRFRNSRMSCMAYGKEPNHGVYVVDKCPRNHQGPSDLRDRCQGHDDLRDPLVSVPVTDVVAGVTFRNRYCAECNGVSPSALKSWLIYLDCESLLDLGVNDSHVWQNLKFVPEEDEWAVEYEGELHTCHLVFDKPAYIVSGIRYCRAKVVSSCPADWLREPVRRACESYTAVLYDATEAFRNPHCALCNGRDASSMTCGREGVTHRKNKPFSFALLLDVNRSDGDLVGVVDRCPRGQKWDPFFKKCRVLVCALPGYTMVDDKCRKL